MSTSFRPTLEPLEDRSTPSALGGQSLGAVAMADVQHTLFHTQLIAINAGASAVAADIRADEKALGLLHGRAAAPLQADVQANQATLSSLQQKSAALSAQDDSLDATSFPILRALFPGRG
jgi:hypothetical protein